MLAERLQGPTVLAGHSYGGAVISGAATGVENVIGLAFAPDEDETLDELGSRFPPPPGLAHTQSDSLGFLWFDPAAIPANFAQDLPVEEARVLAAVVRPIAARCFTARSCPYSWTTLVARPPRSAPPQATDERPARYCFEARLSGKPAVARVRCAQLQRPVG